MITRAPTLHRMFAELSKNPAPTTDNVLVITNARKLVFGTFPGLRNDLMRTIANLENWNTDGIGRLPFCEWEIAQDLPVTEVLFEMRTTANAPQNMLCACLHAIMYADMLGAEKVQVVFFFRGPLIFNYQPNPQINTKDTPETFLVQEPDWIVQDLLNVDLPVERRPENRNPEITNLYYPAWYWENKGKWIETGSETINSLFMLNR